MIQVVGYGPVKNSYLDRVRRPIINPCISIIHNISAGVCPSVIEGVKKSKSEHGEYNN
jgi:hypothetical protein